MERERLRVEQRLGSRCSVQALHSTHGKFLTLGEMNHEEEAPINSVLIVGSSEFFPQSPIAKRLRS